MYEAMNCPIPDREGYLRRIGLEAAPSIDLDGLNRLIWQHQTHVPFEDLNSSYLKRPVPLELSALYEKVVERRRGGYCFELNALFARLLLDLGFDARPVFCRIVRGRDFLPPCAHEGIVVALEGRLYFCDVGFGGPMPGGALPIEDGRGGVVKGEYFEITRYDEFWWTVSRRTADGAREDVLQFNTFPQLPQEFLAVNRQWSTSPESLFVKQILVNLRTEDGFLSITGDEFTARSGDVTRTVKLDSDAALLRVLKDSFGIDDLAD